MARPGKAQGPLIARSAGRDDKTALNAEMERANGEAVSASLQVLQHKTPYLTLFFSFFYSSIFGFTLATPGQATVPLQQHSFSVVLLHMPVGCQHRTATGTRELHDSKKQGTDKFCRCGQFRSAEVGGLTLRPLRRQLMQLRGYLKSLEV